MNVQELKALHKLSCYHNGIINSSSTQECSCFFCLKTFPKEEIKKWEDDGRTAWCPYCDIDSILPGAIPQEVLKQMHDYYFK